MLTLRLLHYKIYWHIKIGQKQIWNRIKYLLLETSHFLSGQEDYDRLRPLSYQEANMVLVCFDVTNPTSFDNVLIKVTATNASRHDTDT